MKCLKNGKSFHCLSIKVGMLWDCSVCNALLDMYAKCNALLDMYAKCLHGWNVEMLFLGIQ